jgi:hypothetical protein
MKYICRIAWLLGNIFSQIVFAFRIGYRDGQMLRPGARPSLLKDDDYKGDAPYGVRS